MGAAVSLPLSRRWLLCALLILALPASAGMQRYEADLHQARWEVTGSRLSCSLAHAIPHYGTARFESRAGGELFFALETMRPGSAAGIVRVAAMPPPWMHRVAPLELGEPALARGAAGSGTVMLEAAVARRLLAALEQGLFPTLTYAEGPDAGEGVIVSISAVNARAAVDEFLTCLAQLLPYDFDAVRQTRVQFAFGKAVLDREARQRLDRVAAYLLADPAVERIEVEAHTDDVGFRRYNATLSRKRGEAVRDYFVAQGVDANKFSLHAYGETRPEASNRTEQGRALNRRAIVILTK